MPAAYASVGVPAFGWYPETVAIGAANNALTFREGDGANPTRTATIDSGTWSYGELAYRVGKALEAAGVSDYDVRYSYSARTFTLTSTLGGGATQLEVTGGSAAAALGFATPSAAGAASISSGTTVPALTVVTFTRPIRFPAVRRSVEREEVRLDNGRSEIVSFGDAAFYSFRVERETVAVAQAFHDLCVEAGLRGAVIRCYPDSTDLTAWFDAQFTEREVEISEEAGAGLYRRYAIGVSLRIAAGNTGTIDARALIDRRPA